MEVLNSIGKNKIKHLYPRLFEEIVGTEHYEYIWYKLSELHSLIHKYKPSNIIELGSGYSSYIFKEYCNVVSFEESEDYANKTKLLVPDLDVIVTDKVVDKGGCYYSFDWAKLCNLENVMVYVDGPSNEIGGNLLPCLDLIHIFEAGIIPPVVAFDVRLSSFEKVINTKYIKHYNIEFSRFFDKASHKHHPLLEKIL